MGHTVEMQSTNGMDFFPNDLRENISDLNGIYDMQLSYTAPRNWQYYLSRGNKNRFAIWNYESTVLPVGMAKNYHFIDQLLPSSNFSKQIFLGANIPETHMTVVPHGIDTEKFATARPYPLKTRKTYKILANIAQCHIRKNVSNLLEAFGKAFTKKDDVCLVLKIVDKKPEQPFDVSFPDIYATFNNKYKDHADIEIIDTYINDIEGLYLSCDMVLTLSRAECFWLPGLEGFAAGKLVIAPRYGGQLDYMNDDNSLLIDGKVVRADRNAQYWTASPYAAYFEPSTNHAATILRHAVDNYDSLLAKFRPNMQAKVRGLSWHNVAKQIESLAK
jgi:O-antigen biosynthesis alpha-1,2-mannosyltransferase